MNRIRYGTILLVYIFSIFLFFDIAFGLLFGNEPMANDRYQPNDTLNHVFRKNYSELINRHPEIGSYIFKTNSLGLKNDEISFTKNTNTKRILLIGDSFVESYDPNKSIKAMLLRHLNKNMLNIELINAGVGTYSPILHYFHYKYFLKSYNPDVVIICVDLTDIRDDYYYSTLLKYDNKDKEKVIGVGNNQNLKREITLNGMIKKNPIFSKIWLSALLSKYSNIFNYVIFAPRKERWWRNWGDKTLIKNYPVADYNSVANGQHKNSDDAYNVTFKYLDMLIEELKDDNIKIVFSIYPHLHTLQNKEIHYSNKMMKYAEKRNIPMHDLYYEILNEKNYEDYYLSGDIHFNYSGIEFWGINLAKFINSISIM